MVGNVERPGFAPLLPLVSNHVVVVSCMFVHCGYASRLSWMERVSPTRRCGKEVLTSLLSKSW